MAVLPPGWTDLLCELELESTDLLAPAALRRRAAEPDPRPGRDGRCASASRTRRVGYGASAGMVRRCLERMEAEGIRGRVRILEVLSDADNVATQGPVWRIAGRPV